MGRLRIGLGLDAFSSETEMDDCADFANENGWPILLVVNNDHRKIMARHK